MFGDMGGFLKILCWDITLFLRTCLNNNLEVTQEQKSNLLILLVKYGIVFLSFVIVENYC